MKREERTYVFNLSKPDDNGVRTFDIFKDGESILEPPICFGPHDELNVTWTVSCHGPSPGDYRIDEELE